MLTTDDLDSLRGTTIIDADLREDGGRQRLRLLIEGRSGIRGTLAISAQLDELRMADESG
jgi:hypothetical protein